MHRFWFRSAVWTGIAASVLLVVLMISPSSAALAQVVPTETASAASAPFVTAQEEGANVRTGPSSAIYPVIGRLQPGETAPAIGVSPFHEWIEIEYAGGTGWVYTAFVTLSPGFLKVVEPPPTPTPLATATIDPTFAAAFNAVPTETRLPTFTPPPPLVVPVYANSRPNVGGFPMGMVIGTLAILGAAVLGVSFFGRR